MAAELIELGNTKLHEKVITTKARYIFSDFKADETLKDATIEFDLGAFGLNYNLTDGDYLQLYCLVGKSNKI